MYKVLNHFHEVIIFLGTVFFFFIVQSTSILFNIITSSRDESRSLKLNFIGLTELQQNQLASSELESPPAQSLLTRNEINSHDSSLADTIKDILEKNKEEEKAMNPEQIRKKRRKQLVSTWYL